MRGLTGKRVLVTGGAQGIGAATASRFLDEGARVAILDKNPEALAETAERLPSLATTIRADVSAAGEVAAAFAEVDRLWGGLDVLVNNAGISIRHRFLDITQEEWRRVIQTNLDGVFYVAREAARRMMMGTAGSSSTWAPPTESWATITTPTTTLLKPGSSSSAGPWPSSWPPGSGSTASARAAS
jgi:meso-butanediol dehydrogenase/(S,S)-butanediol dehydrogenase/diacetyl reductase